jgi:hypothetical protein
MVIFILIGSTVFSLVFQGVNGGVWVEHLLSHLPGGIVGFLIFVNIFVFFLAFFLDFFEIAFIIVPMLAPVAAKMGIDLIWFGVLLCVNMQTSFMHPPFGFALFYLRGIAPRDQVKSSDIYIGAFPWLGLQLVLVAVVILWPESVTYWLDSGPGIDPSTIQQLDIPQIEEAPPLDLGAPSGLEGQGGGGIPGLEPPSELAPPADLAPAPPAELAPPADLAPPQNQ